MEPLQAALEADLSARVLSMRPVSGGDINAAFDVALDDGRRIFVKTHPTADMFRAEADGLRFLAETGAMRIPEVIGFRHGQATPRYLALEFIERGPKADDFEEQLGIGLSRLHMYRGAHADVFGLEHDNFIGSLPQPNAPIEPNDWATFYRTRRLESQLAIGVSRGWVTRDVRQIFSRLYAALPERVGPPEHPSRLHGDLWAGNHASDADGAPILFDPAVYRGHREMDLAMMRLFGGYGPRVFDAYEAASPLPAGHAERVSLFQLYPVLVHANLFGGGYIAQAIAMAKNYL